MVELAGSSACLLMVRGAPYSGAPRRPRNQQNKHQAGFLSAPQFVRQFPDIDPQLTPGLLQAVFALRTQAEFQLPLTRSSYHEGSTLLVSAPGALRFFGYPNFTNVALCC